GKLLPLSGCDNKSAIPSHPQSRGLTEQTGRLTMSQLTHAAMRDRLSVWRCLFTSPVWRRSLHSTQCLPVMGVAARTFWISQRISRGNTVESRTLRGRETVLVSPPEREVRRMLTVTQVGIGCSHKDGEPYARKRARTVREGGHAMPSGPTVPTSPRDGKESGKEAGETRTEISEALQAVKWGIGVRTRENRAHGEGPEGEGREM